MIKFDNPIICVDFDGVIHSYTSGWKGTNVVADPPVDGAIDWLLQHLPPINEERTGPDFNYKGPIAVIYSSRSKDPDGRAAMAEWLVANGIPVEYYALGILQFPAQKPPAFLTIDDRAICFDGTFPTTEEMMSFKPWNKR